MGERHASHRLSALREEHRNGRGAHITTCPAQPARTGRIRHTRRTSRKEGVYRAQEGLFRNLLRASLAQATAQALMWAHVKDPSHGGLAIAPAVTGVRRHGWAATQP